MVMTAEAETAGIGSLELIAQHIAVCAICRRLLTARWWWGARISSVFVILVLAIFSYVLFDTQTIASIFVNLSFKRIFSKNKFSLDSSSSM